MAPPFAAARAVIERAVADRAFPAAVVEVGTAQRPLWCEAFGRLSFDSGARPAQTDTVFDLASLTKVLATVPLVMRAVERGNLGLDDLVSSHVPSWRDDGTASPVTLRDLLAHCSGLPAYAPLFKEHSGRAGFESAICTMPREYAPRSTAVYSDLGFILLGFILEDIAPLPVQFDTIARQMGGMPDIQFHPPEIWRVRTAPARDDDWRGRVLLGEVDDNNAWALGGAAGHAGLFGTAGAVGECTRHVLQVLEGRTGAFRKDTLLTFVTRRTDVPGSSRALGWDTMLPTSSCGARLSPRAFGHTGFTGTSLWIDPERSVYVVLLTNRVHPTTANEAIKAVRRSLHDAVIEDLDR
ncbi:MAG TPA: serine hydrolase domain-containing protein [Vicinamibacterales bacterium]|nr:serine hydrolase domain-containing protein [Vicinamibacterales bacterium]